MLSVLPQRVRASFRLLSALSRLSGRDLKLPRSVINNYLCNGMDTMEVVRVMGFFGPMPTRVMTTRVSLDQPQLSCPVTYVVLTQDKILPPDLQRRIAQRVPGVDLVQLESCHQVMLYKPRELADVLLGFA
jgi:pimeloyl-ACP methyl ester carboxylesterase